MPEVNIEETKRSISMPEELMEFIQRDTYSLLIKGYAGAGKTTLALTILRALGTTNNFFYISTRISPTELFTYYPWLSDFAEKASAHSREETSSDKVELPTFEDARLDEPESLFERITNQLMDIKSPIIIIDSWDAIASFMDKEGRLNNERVLQTWRERAGAKLIFISEHPDDTTLDFLVGGVVELKQRYLDNVKYREILLLKLRGVRIDRPSYVFTLEDSMFRSFDPYVPPGSRVTSRNKSSPRKPIEIISSNQIKSGFPEMDRALGGGLPKAGIVLLEYDERVSSKMALSVLREIISNFAAADNPVLIQPSSIMDPREIIEIVSPSIPSGKKGLLKILWSSKDAALADNIMIRSARAPSETAIKQLRKKYPGRLVLNIVAGDRLLVPDTREIREQPVQDQVVSSRLSDLTFVCVSSSRKEQFEYFSGLADVRIKLLMINGTLFLQPVLPATTLFAVQFDNEHTTADAIV
jgi:KaiC/GvpD/RAD55 family RecA-like ATPase